MNWRTLFHRRPAPAPRDETGRYVSAAHAKILARTRQMYAERGWPIPDVLMGRLDLAAKLEGVGG